MIAVIKGDIIASRKQTDPEKWLAPLKELLARWGNTPKDWELVWGDFFQIEIQDPQQALHKALQIKSLIKSIPSDNPNKKQSTIDVRMAIGIGAKTYSGTRISESNGPAFVHAGEKFDLLKKEHVNLGIRSDRHELDRDMNLYLKLSGLFMDSWTVSSAELVHIVLRQPEATQRELGRQLGIKQNTVSDRWKRACISELLEVESMFRIKLNSPRP